MEYRIGSFGNFDDYLKASYYIKDEETANQNGLEAIITEEENYIVGAFYDKNQFPKEYMFRLFPPKDKTAFILKITIEDLNSYYVTSNDIRRLSNTILEKYGLELTKYAISSLCY